jgi:2-phosphosulfolactate phosphatase
VTGVDVAWGPAGAEWLAGRSDVVVVCDILSFSTTVSVAVDRGVIVYPHPAPHSAEGDGGAGRRARDLGAVLAGPRGSDVSLSPLSMLGLTAGTSVVLSSPNGAMCCLTAARGGATVVAGCLRNAPAVAEWVDRHGGRVGVLAAGERWGDGSLRPAYEDWVGAGAIIAALPATWSLSPEAEAASGAAQRRRPLQEVMSGVELIERGFADDVVLAEAYGVDDVVPVFRDGAFSAAR